VEDRPDKPNPRAPALSDSVEGASAEGGWDTDHTAEADARCVALVMTGRTEAYDELIRRHQRRAASVAYRLLNHAGDALDACQEAFLRAFRSLGSLDDARRFRPWLMRIVTNVSLNLRRERKSGLRLQRLDGDGAAIDEPKSKDGADSPSAGLQAGELQEAIDGAMSALPEDQRVALVLFAIEGLPQKEVAQIMQCSVEMVKWNVFQARKALKGRLAEFLEE
jgi:RNA polymerase sigma-70 factor (ECF subfamily)